MAKDKKENKVKSLVLSNGQVRVLSGWLGENTDGTPLMLHGSESRARTRFYVLIQPRLKEIEEGRLELANKYAKKDKEGKIELDEDKNIVLDKQEEYTKDFTELLSEDFVIDILPSNEGTLKVIKEMVINLKREFDLPGGMVHNRVCEIFEESL